MCRNTNVLTCSHRRAQCLHTRLRTGRLHTVIHPVLVQRKARNMVVTEAIRYIRVNL